jgi:hypothetical protein
VAVTCATPTPCAASRPPPDTRATEGFEVCQTAVFVTFSVLLFESVAIAASWEVCPGPVKDVLPEMETELTAGAAGVGVTVVGAVGVIAGELPLQAVAAMTVRARRISARCPRPEAIVRIERALADGPVVRAEARWMTAVVWRGDTIASLQRAVSWPRSSYRAKNPPGNP